MIEELGGRLALHDVEDCAAVQTETVLGGEDYFGRVDDFGGKAGIVDSLQGVAELRDVIPEGGFENLRCAMTVREAILLGEVLLCERLRQRMEVGHEEEGGDAEARIRKGKVDGDYVGIAYSFPVLGNRLDIVVALIRRYEACGQPRQPDLIRRNWLSWMYLRVVSSSILGHRD